MTAMTDDDASAEQLFQRLKDGDESAAGAVFDRFARRLIGLARKQLDTKLRQKVDPEDVVQSVFFSFFRRQREQQFELANWDNLWSLLAMITVRKCTNVRVRFGRQARNLCLEFQADANSDSSVSGWDGICRDPSPAEAAVLTDMVEQLLTSLPDRDRRIVALCLEGKTVREISADIDRAERTVRRTLEYFRNKLEKEVLRHSSEKGV
jgi:RNA polymerase sigma-70 factor, ECF subfamily